MKTQFARLAYVALATALVSYSLSPVVGSPVAHAATAASTEGQDFWITFDSNNGGAEDLRVYLSSDSDAAVSIDWPNGDTTTHTVTGGNVITVEADSYADSYVNTASQGTASNAIHITSDVDISVYGAHINETTSDAFVAIPTSSLGTTYRLLSHPGTSGRFSIIAVEEGTTDVSITPSFELAGGQDAGASYTVSLEQGEVYTSKSAAQAKADISGTLVVGDKKLVVTAGVDCVNVGAGACDHIVQYMPPTTSWGKSVILPGSVDANSPDRYRVVASVDETTVSIDGTDVATLDAGEVHQFDPTGSNAQQTQLLEAGEPVLVGQFLTGGGSYGEDDQVSGDPSFSLLAPSLQFLSAYNFATPASGFAVNTLTVVAKTADTASVEVAGVTLEGFTAVTGTDYSVSRTEIDAGSYSISSDSGIGIYVSGFNGSNSYSYPGGYAIVDLVENPGGVEEVESDSSDPVPSSAGAGSASNDDDDTSESSGASPETGDSPNPVPRRVEPSPRPAPQVIREGPVLRDGLVPSDVRAPEVRIGGQSSSVQSTVTGPSNLRVRAGVVSLDFQVEQDEGSVSQSDDGATEIAVREGGKTTLSGEGLRPESTVQVFLPLQGSNAKELTRIPVSADGSFSGDAVFSTQPNEDPLPVGRQVMQLVSVDGDGNEVVVDMSINIAQPPPAPELNRVEGVIPALTPGSLIATNAGVPEEVRVSAVEEQKLAVVEGDGWSMAVGVAAEDGGVQATDGGASLTLVRNETARVSGDGFMPGTRADVWLFSEPTLLGTVTIDDEGQFDGEVNIDGRVIAVGNHTLQLQGVGEDGYVRAANMGVTVGDPAEVVATAEENSLMVIWWVLAALVLIALVVVFWIAANRRRQA